MDFTLIKRQLRTNAVHNRSAIEPDYAQSAAQELINFFDQLNLPENIIVSAYWPMKTEMDIRPLMHHLYEKNITVSLPVVTEKEAPLLFRRWEPGAELVSGPYGTEQPNEKYEAVIPTVLLLPLLAFDRKGGRLGYGGGFYDRTIATARSKTQPVVIGIGFANQEIEKIPLEETDETLDFILTEKEIIKVA